MKTDNSSSTLSSGVVFLRFVLSILVHFPMACIFVILSAFGIPMASTINPRMIKYMYESISAGLFNDFTFYAAILLVTELFVGFVFRFSFYFEKIVMFPQSSVIIGKKLISALGRKDISFYQGNLSGQTANTLNLLIDGFREFVDCLGYFVMPIFLCLLGSYSLFLVSPKFCFMTQFWFVGWILIVYIFFDKASEATCRYYDGRSLLFGRVVDFINNIFFIRVFNTVKHERSVFSVDLKANAADQRRFNLFLLINGIWYSLGAIVLQCLNVYFLYYGIKSGEFVPGDLMIVLSTNGAIFSWAWVFSHGIDGLIRAKSQILEGIRILDEANQSSDKHKPDIVVTRGEIEFDAVSFRFGEELLFNNQSVAIKGGTKVALVGYSGAGKSTFTNLILRIKDIESGAIKIDGQDIRDFNRKSLYNNMSVVPQNLTLFSRSILENIRYGSPHAHESEVIEVAKLVMIDDFIEELHDGYNTIVSEGGGNVSGGQKQRILIARALLRDAPILIMDEFTSAIDASTENTIWSNIQPRLQGKTVLIVTHRMTILNSVDRILFFENGKIIEDGSLDDLLKLGGKFAETWEAGQGRGFIAGDDETVDDGFSTKIE